MTEDEYVSEDENNNIADDSYDYEDESYEIETLN